MNCELLIKKCKENAYLDAIDIKSNVQYTQVIQIFIFLNAHITFQNIELSIGIFINVQTYHHITTILLSLPLLLLLSLLLLPPSL